jgi:hypothetical protein
VKIDLREKFGKPQARFDQFGGQAIALTIQTGYQVIEEGQLGTQPMIGVEPTTVVMEMRARVLC